MMYYLHIADASKCSADAVWVGLVETKTRSLIGEAGAKRESDRKRARERERKNQVALNEQELNVKPNKQSWREEIEKWCERQYLQQIVYFCCLEPTNANFSWERRKRRGMSIAFA